MLFSDYSKKDLHDPQLVDAILELMRPRLNSERNKPKLFICCPTAHLEPLIMKYFKGEHYFLTTLGCRFDWNDSNYLELVDNLLSEKGIYEINFIQNLSCPFLKSVVNNEQGAKTSAEEELSAVYKEYQYLFNRKSSLSQNITLLTQLNLYHQIQKLTAFLIDQRPMEFHKFRLSSYTYLPKDRCFEEVELENFELLLR